MAILTLYLAIIYRGLYMSGQAQDTFSRVLSAGLIMTFFIYVFVNMGMVSGILPIVGVPLPWSLTGNIRSDTHDGVRVDDVDTYPSQNVVPLTVSR